MRPAERQRAPTKEKKDVLRLFLWSVAVVMTKRPLEKLVLPSKSSMTRETSVFRSAATRLSITRHRSGYLTATTEWYVTGHFETLLPMAGEIQAELNCQGKRRPCVLKLTVVPSRSCGSTIRGSWATSCGVAVRNCAGRPGSTELR